MKEVEELLPLLDEQVELLRHKLSLMRQMSECVRLGDLRELGELVRTEASLQAAESDLEQRTLRMREKLTLMAGDHEGPVTLGKLVEMINGPLSVALSDRRERLLLLVQQVRQEAAATSMLVRQALELDEQILTALAGGEGPDRTYSADGSVGRNNTLSTFHEDV